ncbi:hypothetical protein WJX81_003990 [Elliptochloris bilobata]|uniref:Uncharacterized protein n=1 Tax=Elliptochloris bilobata TaxID=381761 RepID=A0AAW1QK43_9CHLO
MVVGTGLKGGDEAAVRIEVLATSSAAPCSAPESVPKRRRGRPPKARPAGTAGPAIAKRPRGRPPGTGKNQIAAAAAALAQQIANDLETALSGSSQLSTGSAGEGKKPRRRKSSVPVKAE